MIWLGVLLAGAAVLFAIATLQHRTDWGNPTLNLVEGLNQCLCRCLHRLEHNRIPLPETGPALVAANHVSGLDPLILIAASPRPLRFLIAREQYERIGLTWLFRAVGCIPVDRDRNPEQALRAALRVLQAGEVVAIFPHGGIRLDHEPPKKLKRGVFWLAEKADCPLIPCRIDGPRMQGAVLLPVFLPSRTRLLFEKPVAGKDALLRHIETPQC